MMQFSLCRAIPKAFQAGSFGRQSLPQFPTCWENHAICKLFPNYVPIVATHTSTPYVVINYTTNCVSLVHIFCIFSDLLNVRDAWDMAAEICLSKLPQLIADPNAEFQVLLLILSSNNLAVKTSHFLLVLLCHFKIITQVSVLCLSPYLNSRAHFSRNNWQHLKCGLIMALRIRNPQNSYQLFFR